MDTLMQASQKEKPKISDKLVEATYASIKAGIRLDEREKEAVFKTHTTTRLNLEEPSKGKRKPKTAQQKKQERFLQQVERKNSFEEAPPVDRQYRAHEDRRMGILVIGEQHRFAGAAGPGSDEIFFLREPPLDYSFCLLDNINEIVESESPQTSRNYKQPRKLGVDGRYQTSSLRISYNVLNNLDGLSSMLYKMLEGGPMGLVWLDLSFNCIATLDLDTLSQLPNIRILYLHGNNMADMLEVKKLAELSQLRTLTLHGNPIEQEDGYRFCVLSYLTTLKSLDFFGVTRGDRMNTSFAPAYEKYWEKRHVELEIKAQEIKASEEMSLTARMLANYEEDSDDDVRGELF